MPRADYPAYRGHAALRAELLLLGWTAADVAAGFGGVLGVRVPTYGPEDLPPCTASAVRKLRQGLPIQPPCEVCTTIAATWGDYHAAAGDDITDVLRQRCPACQTVRCAVCA
jgi:hypothetical protein